MGQISLRLSDDLLSQVDGALAGASRSEWIKEAIRARLDEDAAWRARVERGLAQARAGEFATRDEVEAAFERHAVARD